ncbi:MAG: protein disulfide isomerase family protein [bacterium]|nr:protein disulfide isomerase family protein [bacterium]
MKNVIIIAAIGAAIAGVGFLVINPGQQVAAALDSFAQCLADEKVTMYGADWCPHCQNEKKAFGDSFRLVPYVECPQNPKLCLDKGIEGYPTWIFPDGKRLEGEQGIVVLSKESGCVLPQPE